jgi:hypothetical protein
MANTQGTSFIPQRPIRGAQPRGVRKIYVLTYVSYILFFAAVIAAGATFFYNFTLQRQLSGLQSQLASERDQFKESDMVAIRELQQRIDTAQERLNKHISVLSIFDALEQSAVQPLHFTGFTYDRPTDAAPVATIAASADFFDHVVFQREVLKSNPVLADALFKTVALGSEVNDAGVYSQVISFVMEKTIDASLVGYQPRAATYTAPAAAVQEEATNEQLQEGATTPEEQPAADAPEDAQGPDVTQ